jgi:hypothetical protein
MAIEIILKERKLYWKDWVRWSSWRRPVTVQIGITNYFFRNSLLSVIYRADYRSFHLKMLQEQLFSCLILKGDKEFSLLVLRNATFSWKQNINQPLTVLRHFHMRKIILTGYTMGLHFLMFFKITLSSFFSSYHCLHDTSEALWLNQQYVCHSSL